MIVITDRKQITEIAEIPLRQLIEQRIQGIEESCPWDADELGPIIVVEPGDTADDLETVMSFSILECIFDESRFGDEDFVPPPINWTRFCNSGCLSHGIGLTGFEG